MHDSIDRGALRALAAKASDGPWLIERRDYEAGEITYVIYGAHDVTWSGDGACPNARADARYIAAVSPDVVVALLDALDAAERALANARDLLAGANVEDPGAEYTLPVRVLAMVELCRQQRGQARADLRTYGACLHPVSPFAGCASRFGKACDCGLPEALERAEGR